MDRIGRVVLLKMKKYIISFIIIFSLNWYAYSKGEREIPSNAQMATFITKEFNGVNSNGKIYGAFPEKDCLVFIKQEIQGDFSYETINKVNIVTNEKILLINPLSIYSFDSNKLSQIAIRQIWFINENELYFSLYCNYKESQKKSEIINSVFYFDSGQVIKLNENERFSENRFRNDANRHMYTEVDDSDGLIKVYFGDTRELEIIKKPQIEIDDFLIFSGFSDSELILVTEEESTELFITWNYREDIEIKRFNIPDSGYDLPCFSPNGKHIAMFSFKFGILLYDIETEATVYIIDTYKTSPKYYPLYTSVFWSWDSEVLFIESGSWLYSIKMDEINW